MHQKMPELNKYYKLVTHELIVTAVHNDSDASI